MTRFLERDKKTQVNSNLIGVQVRPQVVPPTYEVSELVADIRIDQFNCDNIMNDLPMLYGNNNIWAYTGNQVEYSGTVYNVWTSVNGGFGSDMLTNSNDEMADVMQFYKHFDDPDVPPVVSTFQSEYMLKYSGDLYHFDPNGDYYVSDSNYTYTYLNGVADCSLVDGFFKSLETGEYLGKYISDSVSIDEGINFSFIGEGIGYTTWIADYYFEVYLYSTVRNPSVGDNLISNDVGTEAYTSPVTSVTQEEVDPGYTEDIDCSVSYSVDGETWTDWPENLTDDNNVIANIPRYMYLKFGQDVEITEE